MILIRQKQEKSGTVTDTSDEATSAEGSVSAATTHDQLIPT